MDNRFAPETFAIPVSYNWRHLAYQTLAGLFHVLWVTHGTLAVRHALQKNTFYFLGPQGLKYHCVWNTHLARRNDKLSLACAFVPDHLKSDENGQAALS